MKHFQDLMYSLFVFGLLIQTFIADQYMTENTSYNVVSTITSIIALIVLSTYIYKYFKTKTAK